MSERKTLRVAAWTCVVMAVSALANDGVRAFDGDPGWERFGKTAMGGYRKQVRQDFGWRETNRAGGAAAGEIGGVFQRSLTRAVYWMPIGPRTSNDRLTVSGKFAVVRTEGDSSMHIGFFHESSSGWRTPNSVVFRLSGEDKKEPAWAGKWTGQFSWPFADMANRNWKASGVGAMDGGIYQKTATPPVPSDGKPHDFAVEYDPAGAGGEGEMAITIDGKTWRQAVGPGIKEEGAEFNRFGLMNLMTTGGSMEAYFDDLKVNGQPAIDFAKDPGWEGIGNKASFEDRDGRPHHDLRWSKTNHAGGKPGEIAVTMWRDEEPAYYAAPVGPLSMEDELHAEGRLAFTAAGSDSGVYLGWFNGAAKRSKQTPDHVERPKELIGVAIEGPSRIGHYFRPVYNSGGEGIGNLETTGPVIRPDGAQRKWSIHYDPKATGGNGRITVMLDDQRVELDLKPGAKREGATFDRFGFYNIQNGGHHVKVFVDDVKFTARPAGARAEAR